MEFTFTVKVRYIIDGETKPVTLTAATRETTGDYGVTNPALQRASECVARCQPCAVVSRITWPDGAGIGWHAGGGYVTRQWSHATRVGI